MLPLRETRAINITIWREIEQRPELNKYGLGVKTQEIYLMGARSTLPLMHNRKPISKDAIGDLGHFPVQ